MLHVSLICAAESRAHSAGCLGLMHAVYGMMLCVGLHFAGVWWTAFSAVCACCARRGWKSTYVPGVSSATLQQECVQSVSCPVSGTNLQLRWIVLGECIVRMPAC